MTDSLRTTPAFAVGGEVERGKTLLEVFGLVPENDSELADSGIFIVECGDPVHPTFSCDVVGGWGLSLAEVEQLRDGLNRAIEKMKELHNG